MPTSWPNTVPQPIVSSYGYKDKERTKRIDVVDGKPRIVNQFKEAKTIYPFTLDLTSAELDIFEAFYASVNYGEDEIEVEVITGNGFFNMTGRLVGQMRHSVQSYNRHIISIGFEGDFSKPTGASDPDGTLPVPDPGDDLTDLPSDTIDSGSAVTRDYVYYDVINPNLQVFPE